LTSILDAAADKRADAKEKRKAEYAAMVRRVATGKALAARERDDFATLVQELGLSADDVRNDETAARELLRLEARAAKGISNDALREMEIEQLRVIAAFRKAQLHFHGAKPYG